MTLTEFITTGEPFADDAAALSWLNELVTVQEDATHGDVLTWAAGTDALHRLRTYSAGTNVTERSPADAALVRVEAGLGLSLSDASVQQLLTSLVNTNMFTQAEIDSLNQGSQKLVQRWQHPDNQPLTHGGDSIRNMSLSWVSRARV